jgi:hypothetical protein
MILATAAFPDAVADDEPGPIDYLAVKFPGGRSNAERRYSQAASVPPMPPAAGEARRPPDPLRAQLDLLEQRGEPEVLTDAEFETKKAAILSGKR